MAAIPPSSVDYFYGRISRTDAENILQQRGATDGLYLLRESMSKADEYAVSVCSTNGIHHYSISRSDDGKFSAIGQRFDGPVELVNYYKMQADGLATRLVVPCSRTADTAPMAYPGVTMLELEHALVEAADRKNVKLSVALGPQRQKFISMVAKELHLEQPWFHGRQQRDAAEKTMKMSGHEDGKFLVREKEDHIFVLTLSHNGSSVHYKIENHKSDDGDKLSLEDGPKFDSLMDLMSHHHRRLDGLVCKLTKPCPKPGYQKKQHSAILSGMSANPLYASLSKMMLQSHNVADDAVSGNVADDVVSGNVADDVVKVPAMTSVQNGACCCPVYQSLQPDMLESPLSDVCVPRPLPAKDKVPPLSAKDKVPPLFAKDKVPPLSAKDQAPPLPTKDKVYDCLPFRLHASEVQLSTVLGSGNFGEVRLGVCTRDGNNVHVAVKVLKADDTSDAKAELFREAQLMWTLRHPHILRMIGLCEAKAAMLVLELAALGPLHKYIQQNRLTMQNIIELMHQVALGMAYLESKNFVHRDLAARNVLLADEHTAKISDFGMSKALGRYSDYYKAQPKCKVPIKWYAPECIKFMKFDCKSDVWSYGVTLWEATSYGAKPYKGMKGKQVLDMIDSGRRLTCPELCALGVYDIMLQCWQAQPSDRPTFEVIVKQISSYL